MNGVSVECPAKVNLFLRILAREDTGYHQIETLFQAVGLYDRVDAFPGGEGIVLDVRPGATAQGLGDITAELGDPGDNTVAKAAWAFFAATGMPPSARLVLTKAIPAGTGLGGASSDAAGTLTALNALHGEPLTRHQLLRLGGAVGADVPFFCAGAPTALAWGRGGRLLACPSPPAAPVVLVVLHARTSTVTAYRELSAKLTLPAPPTRLRGVNTSQWRALASLSGNDFERVAFEKASTQREVRDALASAGALVAGLTGSGSGLFGVFRDANQGRDAARMASAIEGIAAAFVVPTLTHMPVPGRIGTGM